MRTRKVLVTGAAGFIGFHLTRRLLEAGDHVIAADNLTPYYDVELKRARLAALGASEALRFLELDLAAPGVIDELLRQERPDVVVHLAAQAGVRYSVTAPFSYVSSNLVGFMNLLEACRHTPPRHFVFASSSSVYGSNTRMPFTVHDRADHPVSLYAATKRSNELLAHSYSHLFGLPTTGLRFFTVYGPWGRPDMAYYLFAKAVADGGEVVLYNEGRNRRVFTYVDDVVEGVARILDRPATADPEYDPASPDPATSSAPFRLYNIGHDEPVEVNRLLALIEQGLGRSARRRFAPMHPGDVEAMWADSGDLERDADYRPRTPLEVGIAEFLAWFREYHSVGASAARTVGETRR